MTEISDFLLLLAEIVGTAAFSAAGTLTGIQRKLDVFGAFVSGCLTAVGGGFIRDIVLGVTPPSLFVHPMYVTIAAVTSVAVMITDRAVVKRKPDLKFDALINFFDSVGLASFVISGIDTSRYCGFGDNAFLTIFVGVVTGIGGGLLRDSVSGSVAVIMHKQVYATVAIAGAIIYYYPIRLGLRDYYSGIIAFAFIVMVRLLAAHYRWDLPKIDSGE